LAVSSSRASVVQVAAKPTLLSQRVEVLALGADVFGGLIGAVMAVLGLVSAAQVALGQSSFSVPQSMQGLLGVVLLVSAFRRRLSTRLRHFHLDPGRFRKVFLLPLVVAPCLFAYRVVLLDTKKDFQSYIRTISEGSVVEWAGFLLLVASAFLVWRTALAWERSVEKWVLWLLAAGLFVVGMEEMSWGQMIFNWQTPKLMNDINVQGESSLHNLWFIHHHTWSIAAVVMSALFFLAVLGAWGRRSGWLKPRSLADILLPVWCTASYFLIAAIIYWCVVAAKAGVDFEFFHTREQELGELMFYSGLFVHSVNLYLKPVGVKSSRRHA
jgi:hypothetical protein